MLYEVITLRRWRGCAAARHQEKIGVRQGLGRLHRFRYYDPSLGIFVSADPLGLDAGLNSFAYCPNSLTWLDPLGLAGTMKRRRSYNFV